jgi:hypothetical protein
MKIKNLLSKTIFGICSLLALKGFAQVPVANFTISPTPICSGNTNIYQIADQSTNAPSAWSYTVQSGFGPGGGQTTIYTVQSPTLSFNAQGAYTISLIATNSSGQSSIVTKTITVLQSPNNNLNPQNGNTCIGGSPVTINVTNGGGGPGAGPVTYSWSNGATSSSIAVSPSVTTVYVCVITATNGCSVTRSSTISIANPTVNITSVPANICPGTTSTLTASGTGPVPLTFTWSTGSNNSAINSNLSSVFTVSVTNGQGCTGVQTYSLGTATTLSLTATSNPAILCAGNSAMLNVTGASNYTWSNGSVISNPTVNPTSNTNYTVTGQIGTCSGTAVYNLSVSITPTLTITSSPASICQGQSFTLSASGANAYTWTPGNINTSSVVVTPGTTTNYTVRGQNVGCPARNGTIALTVAPSPVVNVFASSNTICVGEALALSASGANTYSWSNGSTSALIVVYPTASTVYSVTGKNTSNCSGNASISLTVNECTSLNESLKNETAFTVFPNPSNGNLTISVLTDLKLELINLTGQIIRVVDIQKNSDVKLSGLTRGIYFLRTSSGINSSTKKLIVE